MAEKSEIQTTPTLPTNNEPNWNYVWDEKLCKTTLKSIKPTVYTPPILSVPNAKNPNGHYMCPDEACGKTFNYMSQLQIHLKRHLPQSEKPFKCDHPTCTRAFVMYDKLKCHKRTHTGEKPYECEQCGKRFTRNDHLKKHLRVHIKEAKKKMSPEEVSGDDDGSDDSLTNPKSQKLHKCSVEGCEMAFRVPYELKRHSWTHTKVKTFECDQCKKTFLRKDHLSKHIKTHSRIQQNIKDSKGKTSSDEDSSDASSDATNDSASSSFVPRNSEPTAPVKKEIDAGIDLDQRLEANHQHEIEKIKVETEKITESSLPVFYTSSLRVHLNEKKMKESVGTNSSTAANDFESSDYPPSLHFPIKLEMPVKEEIDTEEEANEYNPLENDFKEEEENIKQEYEIISPSYISDLN